MAHVIKYTKSAVGHMFNHYGRNQNDTANRSNENINPDKTALNYNLAAEDQPMQQLDFLQQRLSEIKVHNRKDVNVMADWVITLPWSIDNPEDEKKFFRETYKFLNDRYGKENVISAYVHRDEVTPHMHYSFVPVTADKKKGGYKLSAKEVISKRDLQSFHENFSDYMQHVFGRDIGVLNGATKEGNRSIQELKRESAMERLHRVTSEVSKIVSEAHLEAQVIKDSLIALEAEYEAKRAFLEGMAKKRGIVTGVEIKKNILTRAEYAKVPIEIWEMKNIFENSGEAFLYANKSFDEKIKEFQKSTSAEHFKDLSERVKKLEDENCQLKSSSEANKKKLRNKIKQTNDGYVRRINLVLEHISSDAKEEFKQEWNKELENDRIRKEMQQKAAERNAMRGAMEIER